MKEDNLPRVSSKVYTALSLVHRAFMQSQKDAHGQSQRKQYWQEAWSETKNLSLSEMKELVGAIETTRHTLRKLNQKIEELRAKKIRELAETSTLDRANEWEEDEFLDSSVGLPVFNPKTAKTSGKRWVITKPLERPRNTIETCQAAWTVITNRALSIVDKGKDVKPSLARDVEIEKYRLAVLPYLLDDKIITDPLSGKPLMNIYMITPEVKETILWLLAQRARSDAKFGKLFTKFLKKEIVAKEKLFEWAKRFTPLSLKILGELPE